MAEFIINPHSVEFAHPRFWVGVREDFSLWILHKSIDGHSQAAVGFAGAEYPEIEHAETAVVPFVGVVVLYDHLFGERFVNGLNQESPERGGLLDYLRRILSVFMHSACVLGFDS